MPVTGEPPTLRKQFRVPPTPVDIHLFSDLLKQHPDKTLTSTVLDRLRDGADIGLRGSSRGQVTHNNMSAILHHSAVSQTIQKEVERGHTCGPFPSPPLPDFQVNPHARASRRTGPPD